MIEIAELVLLAEAMGVHVEFLRQGARVVTDDALGATVGVLADQ